MAIGNPVGNSAASDPTIRHIPKFGGELWYVSAGVTASGNGKSPDAAFKTIGEAITAMGDGDAVTIMAGTYTETGLDLSNAAAELWCEIGVVIDPATGTALTVSGNYCHINGNLDIDAPAGEIGLLMSGNYCDACNVTVLNGATGIHVTGAGCFLRDMASGFPTAMGYNIDGTQTRLYSCHTAGNASTIGYNIGNGADTGVVKECTSIGHAASGFTIETGCSGWTMLNCSSGGGDGRWVDVDEANVWTNFSFANKLHKNITCTGGVTTFNLFKLTGAVRISDIHAIITTVIPDTVGQAHLELYSSGGAVDITDDPGANLRNMVVGGLVVRNADSTIALAMADPDATPAVAENVNYRDPKTSIDIVEDDDNDTYVRMVLGDALATGAMEWHCEFEPLSDDGWLAVV